MFHLADLSCKVLSIATLSGPENKYIKKKVDNFIFTHSHISSHYKRRIIAQGQKWAKFNFLIVC